MELDRTSPATEKVNRALDILTRHVNVSYGITHPNDFKKAVDIFDQLYESGEYPHPDEVKNYLVSKGWKENHARDVATVWMAVATLKDFQTHKTGRVLKQGLLI